jgi:hypothetical protein
MVFFMSNGKKAFSVIISMLVGKGPVTPLRNYYFLLRN